MFIIVLFFTPFKQVCNLHKAGFIEVVWKFE